MVTNKTFLFAVSFCIFSLGVSAKNTRIVLADTSVVYSLHTCHDLNRLKPTSQTGMLCISSALISAGIMAKHGDCYFRDLRNTYTPTFSTRYDDYLQYLPAAVLVGMKLSGVKGRSSWGNMLVADAFSIVLMAGSVNALKSFGKVTRPDGSNTRSFPSGHTATAFMTATMMSKEYGENNLWYRVGAYSIASATAMSRMLNNKHWLSDVLAGAGIGILSTECGYLLADLIFDKESERTAYSTLSVLDNPSFLGCYWGGLRLWGCNESMNDSDISFLMGNVAGFEGAYFFTPYIGIGGGMGVGNIPVETKERFQSNLLSIASASAGVYFCYPLSNRWQLGSKLLLGYSHCNYCKLPIGREVASWDGFALGSGYSVSFRVNQDLGVKLFVDYTLPKWSMNISSNAMRTLAVGGATYISF